VPGDPFVGDLKYIPNEKSLADNDPILKELLKEAFVDGVPVIPFALCTTLPVKVKGCKAAFFKLIEFDVAVPPTNG
jgi:hypothetical protein